MERSTTLPNVSDSESEAHMRRFFSVITSDRARDVERFGEEAAFRIPREPSHLPEAIKDRPSDRVSVNRIIDAAREARVSRDK